MSSLANALDQLPILLIGLLLFCSMVAATLIGYFLRKRTHPQDGTAGKSDDGGSDAYIISAVLGLLALLLGFTFSLAVNRYEARRALVLQESNAIGTSYLRAQALPEPHRSRLSKILVDYTENRLSLSANSRTEKVTPLLARNDQLLTDLWSATLAANDAVRTTPFSVSLLSTVNEVIDMDASRKAARTVRVPTEVFLVLWVYVAVTAGIMGYARSQTQGRVLAGLLFVLLTMSYMLILDIDRPGMGGIQEGQGPMLQLRESLRQQPPGTFDTWRHGATPS
ncbi:DUF4239 domain-containing protein [Sphingobium sp. AP49]|uniref:bestrophin-like domain n=1 Tax=Sphingobium sp. AP49 TaxID=1144307 RepID=UPI00026ECD33|nr:DUF4239 domain-containing protein [Sphingobium sp. AP49]WHO40347.1 DUF4239 domain-containing protein [Sphingobium sp. AP49]